MRDPNRPNPETTIPMHDPASLVFRHEGNTVALYLDHGPEGTVSAYSALSMNTITLECGDLDRSIVGCSLAAPRGGGVTLAVGPKGGARTMADFDQDDVAWLYESLVACRSAACDAGKIPPLARPYDPAIEPKPKAPVRAAKRARKAA